MASIVSTTSKPIQILRRSTQLSFWALIILIPFRYRILLQSRQVGTIYGDYTDFLIFASDIALIVTLTLWITGKLIIKEPLKRGPFFVTLPLLVLTFVSGISAIGSVDPLLSAYHVARLVLLVGLVFYVVDQVQSVDQIVLPVAIQVTVQAIVGVSQFLRQGDIGLQAWGEYLLNPQWAGVSIVVSEGTPWLRAYGLSDHPNILGGCLAFGLLILLGHCLTSKERARVAYFAAFGLGCVALFLTFSRASWLAFGIGALVLMFLVAKERPLLLQGLDLLGGALLLLAPFLVSYANLSLTRVLLSENGLETPVEQQSIGERVILNDMAIQAFIRHPMLGIGIGALPEAFRQQFPNFTLYYQPAHNTLIDAAAETGLFGAAAYGILLAGPWLALVFRPEAHRSLPLLTISMALLAVTIVGLFDYYAWLLPSGRLWQYVIWGLWMVEYRTLETKPNVI